MLIKDLEARQSNVDVEGEVIELSDVREFDKFGKKGRVASAIITDGSGKIKLSLWNEQIEKVKIGDKVKIQKGYVSEFQGELQLTTGKFGALEVVKEDESIPAAVSARQNIPSSSPEETFYKEPEEKKIPEKEKSAAEEIKLDIEEEDFS
jgi:replication factor A1